MNYSGVTQGRLSTDQGLARVDQYFSAKDQVFFHYIRSRRDFPNYELNPNFYFNGTFPEQQSFGAVRTHVQRRRC